MIVAAINGVTVKNLLHLVQLLRDSQAEFTVINFAGLFSETLVLPHQECLKASEEILNDSGIRAQGSLDALSVWNERTGTKTTETPAEKPN